MLAEGGEIYVASDVFDIALDAMSVLERDCSRRLVNLREPWTFLRENPFAARSRRERQCETTGIPIWRLGYRRA